MYKILSGDGLSNYAEKRTFTTEILTLKGLENPAQNLLFYSFFDYRELTELAMHKLKVRMRRRSRIITL